MTLSLSETLQILQRRNATSKRNNIFVKDGMSTQEADSFDKFAGFRPSALSLHKLIHFGMIFFSNYEKMALSWIRPCCLNQENI